MGVMDDTALPLEDPGVGDDLAADVQPEPSEWSLSREDWEQTQQFMQTVGPFVGALANEIYTAQQQQQPGPGPGQMQNYPQQPAAPGPQLPEFDPFDPASVQAAIDARVQAGVEQAMGQALAPYEGVMASVVTERGESLANAVLDEIEQTQGSFNRDVAIMLAAPLVEAGVNSEQALRACAGFAQAFEAEIRTAERERIKSEMQGLSQLRTSGEAGPLGMGMAEETERVPTGKKRYEEAVARALARRRPVNPVG